MAEPIRIIRLTNPTVFDMNKPTGSPDKAKPSVRRGRRAAGLLGKKMAELPKDEPSVSSAFF